MVKLNPRMQVRAKKGLGQHFLKDEQVAERIVDTVRGFEHLPILEVGPGMGVLSRIMLDRGYDLHAVELDRESIAYLRRTLPSWRDKIVEADFLHLPLTDIFPIEQPFVLIGNYPYNISSQIFFKVIEYRDQIPMASGMLQREVALRLSSPPGSKAYGILSVLLQAWYEIDYIFTVDEHVFSPPPKVKSGVIRLVRNKRRELPCDEKRFKQVVKTAFNQRRKTLRNSLRALFADKPDTLAADIFSLRPEQLSVEDFIRLTLLLPAGEL